MIGNTSLVTIPGTPPSLKFSGGGGVVEPAIDDSNGNTVYLLTPTNAQTHANAHNVAKLYLPVYPVGSGIDPTVLNCQHLTALLVLHDNCPDHGPGVAYLSQFVFGVDHVYDNGVLGHDHLVGIASTGGDFNIIWEPTLVLFRSVTAASTRITLLSQIQADELAGTAYEVSLAPLGLDFNCASVPAAVYNRGTPAPTVVGP